MIRLESGWKAVVTTAQWGLVSGKIAFIQPIHAMQRVVETEGISLE